MACRCAHGCMGRWVRGGMGAGGGESSRANQRLPPPLPFVPAGSDAGLLTATSAAALNLKLPVPYKENLVR